MVAIPAADRGPSHDEIRGWAETLEDADPDQIVQFALDHFGPGLAIATQFGPEGTSLLHRVARQSKNVRFFTIDTGLMFRETLELADTLEKRLDIEIERVRPRQTVAAQAATVGPNLWESDPDLCCTLRKVQPMVDALYGMGAWMTGLRRSQSPTRANTPVVQWDERFSLVKFAPLARESQESVERYIKAHRLPNNPLRALGYLSIGCLTCTRPVKLGEHERAGRWAGREKTECGLHTADGPVAIKRPHGVR